MQAAAASEQPSLLSSGLSFIALFLYTLILVCVKAAVTCCRLLDDKLVSPRDLDPTKRFLPLGERHKVSMRYSTFADVPSDTVIQVEHFSDYFCFHGSSIEVNTNDGAQLSVYHHPQLLPQVLVSKRVFKF